MWLRRARNVQKYLCWKCYKSYHTENECLGNLLIDHSPTFSGKEAIYVNSQQPGKQDFCKHILKTTANITKIQTGSLSKR